jgi:small ligand-binding sensory domain FIST
MLQVQRTTSSLPRILVVCAALASGAPLRAGTLDIISTPPGATVEINGVAVDATPYHQQLPDAYFHTPHSMFTGRLEDSKTLLFVA